MDLILIILIILLLFGGGFGYRRYGYGGGVGIGGTSADRVDRLFTGRSRRLTPPSPRRNVKRSLCPDRATVSRCGSSAAFPQLENRRSRPGV